MDEDVTCNNASVKNAKHRCPFCLERFDTSEQVARHLVYGGCTKHRDPQHNGSPLVHMRRLTPSAQD